jgi:hypothetical protein
VVSFVLVATAGLPFVQRLPFGVQRSLSFLPIDVNPIARADADATATWRWEIWKALLPQVSEYFFLGKGLAMTPRDLQFSIQQATQTIKAFSAEESWAALSGDYHSGPLSVTIPFGVWGDIAFLWFLWAGFTVLYKNYRYGDQDLKLINSFLLAAYTTRTIIFFLIFGGLWGDIHEFIGYLAFSISLNGGVVKPVPEPTREAVAAARFAATLPRPRLSSGRSD